VAGTALTPALTVIARDAFGNAVPTFTGTVTVSVAGANPPALAGTTSRAAVSGTATFNDLLLQRAGEVALVVSSGTLAPDTTSTVQVAPGTAAKLVFVQQPSNAVAAATMAPAVTVRAYDAFNNVATGFTGGIALTLLDSTGATLGGTTTVSAVAGVSTFSDLAVARSGSGYRLQASSSGLAADTSAAFSIAPGTPAQLAIILPPPAAVIAGGAFDVHVRVRDASGNTVPGFAAPIAIAFDAAPTGASFLAGNAAVTPSDGDATFLGIRLDRIGVYRLRFSSDALSVVSADIAVTSGAAQTVRIVSGDAQTGAAGAVLAQPLVAEVNDALGNPIDGAKVTWSIVAGSGSIDSTSVAPPAAGQSAAIWTLGIAAGTQSVRAAYESLTPVEFSATATPAVPASLAFLTQPVNVTAGDSLPQLRVAVRNGAGVTIPDFNGSVTLALTGGTAGAALVGVTSVEAVAGVATFTNLRVNRGGSAYRVVATQGVLPPAQSDAFDAAAAPAAAIAVLGGGEQSAPIVTTLADSIRVRVTDAFDFPVPGTAVQFTVTQGGGSVTAASVLTDADGRASVRWTTGTAGPQQLRVHVGSIEQFVGATAFATGPTALFAGVDYTTVRVGGTRSIPLYLTNPSATPIEVTLSIAAEETPTAAWTTSTITFAPGMTRVDATISGVALGSVYALVSSSVGEDSINITVDSSYLSIASLDDYSFTGGDTIRTFVRISDPAPPGGQWVTVRSSDTTMALIAPSTGSGLQTAGCFSAYCSGGDIQAAMVSPAVGGSDRLAAPPADSARVFIREGELIGEFAVVLLPSASGCASLEITAEAAGFAGASRYLVVQPMYVYHYLDYLSGYPSAGVGVGQVVQYYFYTGTQPQRDMQLRFESSDTTRVRVDTLFPLARRTSTNVQVAMHVVGTDSAWVRYWIDPALMDSLLIVGTTPVVTASASTYTAEDNAVQVTLGVSSASQPSYSYRRSAPLTFTLTSSDTTALAPDRSTVTLPAGQVQTTVGVRMKGGTADLTISAPGHESQTLEFGSFTQAVQFYSFNPTVGVGQLHDHYVYLSYAGMGARSVTVTSSNPAIAEVVTPTIAVSSSGSYVRIRGVATGTTQLQFTGPQLSPTAITVFVNPTMPYLNGFSPLPPDGLERGVGTSMREGFNNRILADTVRAVLRSSNPAVLQVSDSLLVFPAGNLAYSSNGRIRPLAPGSATLWLVRPGVDSVSQLVTVNPYAALASFSSVVVGEQLQANLSLYREGPDTLASGITITHSGPGLVSIHDLPAAFPIGQYSLLGRFVGETVGVDTLTITVDGYAPIQRVVYVENTSASVITGYEGEIAGTVAANVFNSFSVTGVPGATIIGKPLRFRVIPLDTSMVEAVQDTIAWNIGDQYYSPSRYATLRYKKPGTTSVAIVDLDGVIDGDTTVIDIEPSQLSGSSSGYYGDDALYFGMSQQSDPYEVYVQRPTVSTEPLWVRLESSNPALVTVPDSVRIGENEYFEYFSIVTGDTTGSARVTASAPGWNPWVFEVVVSRAKFALWSSDMYLDGGDPVDVYLVDALSGYSHGPRSDIEARFVTSTPALLDAASSPAFTVPAGQGFAYVDPPTALMPGSAVLGVTDIGPVRFDSVATGYERLEVRRTGITTQQDPIRLSVGLRSSENPAQFTVLSGRPQPVVRFTSLQGRFFAPDSVVADLYYYGSVAVTLAGLTQGRDTLVASVDGIGSDTVMVEIAQGLLVSPLGVTGRSVVVGDSTLVQVNVRDVWGAPAVAIADITLTASISDGSFVVVENDAVVNTVTIEAETGTVLFWVRADALGTPTLTLSHPNFRPFSLRLNSVQRP